MNIFTKGEQPDIKDYVGEFVIVLGKRGSGKSNVLTVVAEELLKQKVSMSVLDLEDEFGGLIEEKAVSSPKADVKKIAKDTIMKNSPVRFDLSDMDENEMQEFLADYLNALWDVEKAQRVPHCIVIDELWTFAPQSSKKTGLARIFQKIALRGRKYGLFVLAASQRSSNINKDIITQAGIYFLTKVTHPADLKVYREIIGDRKIVDEVPKLQVGECIYVEGDQKLKRKARLAETELGGKTPTLEKSKPAGEPHKKTKKKSQNKMIFPLVLGLVFIAATVISAFFIGIFAVMVAIALAIIFFNVVYRKKSK